MTATTTRELDQAKAGAFGEQLLETLNGGALAMMISIGHRTELFDLMSQMEPATSDEIAERAGLNERYVREWLGAMVTGRIMEYDPDAGTYFFPPEHAASLTRAASPSNLASMMQWISVLGGVESDIVKRFYEGGGVSYECFHRFHEVMAEESVQTVVSPLIEDILPITGLGEALAEGIDVLDVGCGSGGAMIRLAEEFPDSRFTGYDLCEEAVTAARAAAQLAGLSNVHFEVKDVTKLGDPGRFELITAFDAIHDQANPSAVLSEIAAALKPGGTFLMQDIAASSSVEKNLDHPIGPMLYTISCMHCMTVSLAQGGAGLGTVWGIETAKDMLRDAGFASVQVEKLEHDFLNCYYIARKNA